MWGLLDYDLRIQYQQEDGVQSKSFIYIIFSTKNPDTLL